MSKLNKLCESILKKEGPMLTGELAKKIMLARETDNIDAARMAISRLKPPIFKIDDISFNENQKFIYLQDQEKSFTFKRKLIELLIEHGTSAGRAILALRSKKQIIKEHFPIITGTSNVKIGKNTTSDQIFNQLLKNGLVIETEITSRKVILTVAGDDLPSSFSFEILDAVERLTLEMCKDWAIRIGLGSMGTTKTKYNELPLPEFGFISWDLASASYLHGLRTKRTNKEIPGGFIVDLYLQDDPLTRSDLASYFNKIFMLRKQNVGLFIPALIHKGIAFEILGDLRNLGVMCLEVRSFGDKKVGELISELILLVNNIRGVVGDETKLNSLLDKMMSKDIGRLLNLPGPLFMMTIAFLYKKANAIVVPNEIVTSSKGKAEIDLFVRENHRDLVAVEVKGYKAGKKIDLSEIEEWITEKRPKIIEWYKSVRDAAKYQNLRFEFIISSTFTKGELEHLQTLADKEHKNFPVAFYDINYVIELAKKEHLTTIVDGLKEHFLPK